LGQHLKKTRLELGLTQKEAGQRLGVTSFAVISWKYDLRKPAVQHIPAIRRFLGYDPEPSTSNTLAERLAAKRRALGWTQKEAACKLGVDPSTWSTWEAGGTIMAKAHRVLVARFTGFSETDVYAAMRKRWNDSHDRPTPEGEPPR